MKFKPKIRGIIQEYDMDPLVLIPKNGGLKDIVGETMKEMGMDYLSFRKIDRNNYEGDGMRVMVYRGEDIPKIVEDYYFDRKIKALGFTGDDLFDEYRLRNPGSIVEVLETIDWDDDEAMYRRPRLSVITRDGETPTGKVNIAVNRKYELTSRLFIDEVSEEMGIIPNIRVYSGNTEDTVVQGVNDMAIEIVYTGDSVKRNNLRIGDKVRYSDFDLIGVDESSPLIFEFEYRQLKDRKENPREDSYTSRQFRNLNDLSKKPGEELMELNGELRQYDLQPTRQRQERIVEEYADLNYTLQLNLIARDIDFREITKEMYSRRKRE